MKKEDLIDAVGNIDEEYIEEADRIRIRKPRGKRFLFWIPVFAAAAFAAVVLLPRPDAVMNGAGTAGAETEEKADEILPETEAIEDAASYVYTYQAPGVPGTWERLRDMKEISVFPDIPLSEAEMTENVSAAAEKLGFIDGGEISGPQYEDDNVLIRSDEHGTVSVEYKADSGPDGQTAADLFCDLFDDPMVYETEFYDSDGAMLYDRIMIFEADGIHYAELMTDPDGNLQSASVFLFKTDNPEKTAVPPAEKLLKDVGHEEDVYPPAELKYIPENGKWVPVLTVYTSAGTSFPTAWTSRPVPLTAD